MPNFDIAALNKQVIADAWEQHAKITDNLTAMKKQKLTKVEDDLKQSIGREVSEETARTKSQAQKQLGEVVYANKRSLIAKRTEMEREIFAQLRRRLEEFCAGGQYPEYFEKRLARESSAFAGEHLILTVCGRDETEARSAVRKLGLDCEVETDRDIAIGGFRLCCEARGMVYDDTLDSEFERRREWFKQTSQLTIA